MTSLHRQEGVTLLNVLVAIVVGAGVMLGILQIAQQRERQAVFDRTLAQARLVAEYAYTESRRVTATAMDPTTFQYTYTHGRRSSSFVNANTLTALYPDVVGTTAYGTNIEYLADGNLGIARFEVPAAFADLALTQTLHPTATLPGGNVRVTVTAQSVPVSTRSRYMKKVKSQVFLETQR